VEGGDKNKPLDPVYHVVESSESVVMSDKVKGYEEIGYAKTYHF
jgi:hypothetical protein